MTAPKFSKWPVSKWFTSSLRVGAVLCAASSARAETHDEYYDLKDTSVYVDNTDHDLQFFSPVDFDFENRPISQCCGYFFRFDKLNWAATGERVTVGDPNEVVLSELIYGDSPFSFGSPPPQYLINNSIQDAPPDGHDFAWGSRYELGYGDGEHSWSIGILDGPDIHGHEMYGFESISIPNSLPIPANFSDPNFDIIAWFESLSNVNPLDGTPTGSDDIVTSRNGWGSVHVNFRTPEGFLDGFVDYNLNTDVNQQTPNLGGPGRAVIIIEVEEGDDGFPVVTSITTRSGSGDGLPDDLSGNGLAGFFFIVNEDDEVIGTGIDYEDLHTFNIAFERFDVRNLTQTDGVELMKTFTLDNEHLPIKRQGDVCELGVGVRYLRINDEFAFEGEGGILGRTYATTIGENNVVGPQIRGRWSRQINRWNIGVDTRMLFGYNVQNQSQYGAIGEDLNPGAVNSPIFAQPHAVSYARQQENFSPTVELRAEASYQITRALAARVGYTGIFVDNITRASQTVNWYLPDLGILRGGEQEIYINGLDFGFDVVY